MSDIHLLSLSDNNSHPYEIIYSKRAKYVRIKLSNSGDLTVVLPKGISSKVAHKFIKNKIFWVEKNLQNISVGIRKSAPEVLDLKLIGESWDIEYETTQNKSENLEVMEQTDLKLRIFGNAESINNVDLLYKSINQWCKKKAKAVFKEMLEGIAEQYGFHFQKLSVRAQKTRWGSCSNSKNISLNCKLLLMPEEVATYVMIHELCHTIEMNHSLRFWSLVQECDPQYKKHRSLLRRLGKEIVL